MEDKDFLRRALDVRDRNQLLEDACSLRPDVARARIVSEALSSPPSLDELAEALHMPVSSLAHRSKAGTGFTVVDRVCWLRIREARRLLAQPGATVRALGQQE